MKITISRLQNLTKLAIVLFFSINLLSCKKLISQSPEDLFFNGKLPAQLEKIRNQLFEISVDEREKIIARSEQDLKRNDLLKVAVIDSGADIAHDDLQSQLIYKVENKRIVGAGYDVMSGSNFASHVFINPTLFAFNALQVIDGKILPAAESPLANIAKIQNRFQDILIQEIQNNPVLANSYFSKLTKNNTLLTGFYHLYKNRNALKSEYSDNLERKMIVHFDKMDYQSVKDRQLKLIKLFADQNWTVSPEQHQIQIFDYMPVIEHADLFLQVLEKTFVQINNEYQLENKLKQMKDFKIVYNNDGDDSELWKDLTKAIRFIHWGASAYDPIQRLESLLQTIPEFKNLKVSEALVRYQNEMTKMLQELLKNPQLTEGDLKIIKKKLNAFEMLSGIVQNYQKYENNPKELTKLHSAMRRMMYRTQHPYLEPESNTNSHHTHVAGTIAAQNKNIRIFPVRVTTQSLAIGPDRKEKLVREFLQGFAQWIELPLMKELLNEIKSEYGITQLSQRTIMIELKKYLIENDINLVFISDVLDAVDVVGKNQIKLANVSLGTVFKKKYNIKQKTQGLVIDLFSEFARYKIGERIEKNAPGTLFMIATGNDGDWVDGISKAAFPVGIHSLRLKNIAASKGFVPPPNNRLKNVLAVSSVNPNGSLTEFGNSIIDLGVPQVFSTGEEIRSTVPGKDSEMYKQVVSEELVKIQILEAMIHKYENQKAMDLDDPNKINAQQMFKNFKLSELQSVISDLLSSQLQAEYHIGRDRKSGTSMATPTVTGIIANYLLQKMKLLKIDSKDIYLHPAFQPQTIIDEVIQMAKPSKYKMAVDVRMLVEGIKEWEASSNEKKLKKMTKTLFSTKKIKCEPIFTKGL